jgi:uncharacterized protein YcbK (DUF882 family)
VPSSTARKTSVPHPSRAARRFGLAACFLIFATSGLQTAVANGETRTLKIHHTHSGEDITVTYKRNGSYDAAGLAKLNQFLRDWRNHEQTTMDPKLFDIVWEVYQEVGGKEPIQIISAYRSPKTNAMLRSRSRGVAQFSQHMLGKAMDFNIPGVSLEQIRYAGLRLQRGGVGFYPSSGSPFVHLDVGSVRHWPRMTHDQLARVFPTGRTVHVPSNGQPLSNYTLALADVERRGGAPSATSLASARSAGVVGADGAGKGKRSLFARLFSGATSDDDDEDVKPARATTATVARAAPPEEPVRKPVQLAAAVPVQLAAAPVPVAAAAPVPMPRARPSREPAPQAVALKREAPASAAPTPSQIILARGLWDLAPIAAATESTARTVLAERMTRQAAVQPAAPTRTAAVKPTPRPRPAVVLASAGPTETTASLPPFPGEAVDERGASDMVLSYAPATRGLDNNERPAPMGALAPDTASVVRKTLPGRVAVAQPPTANRLGFNPWLRGVMVAPSMQTSMDVTLLGVPDYRALARLMHKPRSLVASTFADDRPEFGLSTDSFTGEAIAVLPMVSFGHLRIGMR